MPSKKSFSNFKFLAVLLAFCMPAFSYGAKSSEVKCIILTNLTSEAKDILALGTSVVGISKEQMNEKYYESMGYTSPNGWMELNESAAAIIAVTSVISGKPPAELLRVFATKIRHTTNAGAFVVPETMAATMTAYQLLKKLDTNAQIDTFKELSNSNMYSLKPFLDLVKSVDSNSIKQKLPL